MIPPVLTLIDTRDFGKRPQIPSAEQLFAMYYRNLGAAALQRGDTGVAGWLIVEALKYAPQAADGINLMAVIYRHLKRYQKAESLYRHGLLLAEQNLYLLSNNQLWLKIIDGNNQV